MKQSAGRGRPGRSMCAPCFSLTPTLESSFLMNPSNRHPVTVARGRRRTFLLEAVRGLLITRGRRLADRVRARRRLEGLEDRCLLSITEYPIPTVGANPYRITAGPDGNLWFTEASAGKI